MIKEYDSPLPREELIARLREKTVPFHVFRLICYDWELKEYDDGTFRAIKSHGRFSTQVILRFDATGYGTHITVEYLERIMYQFFGLLMILIALLPICTIVGVHRIDKLWIILPVVLIGCFLLFFLLARSGIKEAIEWVEIWVLRIRAR